MGREAVIITPNRLNRRTFAGAAAWSALTLAAPRLWGQARLEKTRIAIGVKGKAAFNNLPITIAERLGYFKAEGLQVEIYDGDRGSLALQGLLNGSVDIVSGDYEQTLDPRARVLKLQAFVLQGRAPAIAMGVVPKALPDYKSVGDLRGKKIGLSEVGSATQTVARLILARSGIKAGGVSFVDVGNATSAMAAMRSGEIDALSSVDPLMTLLEQKGDIRIIADTRTLKGTLELFGGPMPAGCLAAPLAFIQKNPLTVQAITDAMARSLKWLQTASPNDILKTVPQDYLMGDRAMYLAAFNKVRATISLDGTMPDEGPANVLKVLARFDAGFRVDKIDLSKTYTNEFALAAKDRSKT